MLNAGAGHLEGFGSVAGVIREKLSLAIDAPLAVVGVTPPELAEGARALATRVVTAGLRGTDVRPDLIEPGPDGRPVVHIDGQQFSLAARGVHQAGNAMLRVSARCASTLDAAACARALEGFTIPATRRADRAWVDSRCSTTATMRTPSRS